MKKLLYLLPLMALLFSACSDDDDVAKNFNVTVSVTAGDDIVLSSIQNFTVTAVNLSTSKEQTATPANGSATFSLPTGKYDFKVTGTYDGKDVNGLVSSVDVSADQTVELVVKYANTNSTLIFKEVYFSGVPDYYFKDGFYEIYNNSDEV